MNKGLTEVRPSARIRSMEEIGLRRLRHEMAETINRVSLGTPIVVTMINRPKAVLISVDEYERLTQPKLGMAVGS